MVETEHHQRVGVGQDSLVDRQLVAGLVDALEDGDRVPGGFSGELLECQGGPVEELHVPAMPCRKLPRRTPCLVAGHRTLRTSVIVEKRFSIAAGSRCASQG